MKIKNSKINKKLLELYLINSRAYEQYDLPPSLEKVCRGPVIDQTQYMIDIKEWDYKVTTIKTV